ncbi:5929_t:CDS:1, partial [Cetraspora pellucida]
GSIYYSREVFRSHEPSIPHIIPHRDTSVESSPNDNNSISYWKCKELVKNVWMHTGNRYVE